jgi:multiple sugar transport system permease protein
MAAGASPPNSWRDPSEKTLASCCCAPAFILLALIVVYPIGKLIWNSFHDLRLSGGGGVKFVGFENYLLVFKDPDFWNAATNTVLITVITVPGALVVGMGLALLANLPFRYKWPVRLALLLPWALPLSFAGLIFAWFFHTEYGVVNDVLRRLGSPAEPTMWLLRPNWAFAAICMTIIWKTSRFMALILLAGLQMIPRSLYEAAEVDGASRWQQFWQITIPMLMPSIVVALIFRTITALQTFDIPYTMTKGGPGNSTETLAMLIHKTTIDYLDVGYGSALAVCMFVLSLVVTGGLPAPGGRQGMSGASIFEGPQPAPGSPPAGGGQRLLPGAVDPADLAQDRGRAGQQAHHLVAAQPDAGQLRAGLHRPAAAALPGQQPGGGAAGHGVLAAGVGAGGLCHRAAEPAPAPADPDLHRRQSSMFPLVTLLVPIFETMRSWACSTPTPRWCCPTWC